MFGTAFRFIWLLFFFCVILAFLVRIGKVVSLGDLLASLEKKNSHQNFD